MDGVEALDVEVVATPVAASVGKWPVSRAECNQP
jgi:hypothetical protein